MWRGGKIETGFSFLGSSMKQVCQKVYDTWIVIKTCFIVSLFDIISFLYVVRKNIVVKK